MKLSELLKSSGVIPESDIEISSIVSDSRKAGKGSLFYSLKSGTEGAKHIKEAFRLGASAVIAGLGAGNDYDGTVIEAEDVKAGLASACLAFYGNVSNIKLAAVTGTNGKTSQTYLIDSVLREGNKSCIIGTINHIVCGEKRPSLNTTPDLAEIWSMLGEIEACGGKHCVMEVSSHALSQNRVIGIKFDVAVFTNLSRDHLDYHVTMENYYLEKKKLFINNLADDGTAIINIDDEYGKRLSDELSGRVKVVSIGIESAADVYVSGLKETVNGIEMAVHYKGSLIKIQSALLGRVNTENLISASAACLALGARPEAISTGLSSNTKIKGRLEKINHPNNDFSVIVDYAHTPDALSKALSTCRALCTGRLICVFGCGGDRDKGKRPLMGEVVSNMSDTAFVTSDNPRSEEPEKIINEIIKGMNGRAEVKTESDRKKAIAKALFYARKEDVVLIAGKGHEDYQISGDRKVHFDDSEEALKILDVLSDEKEGTI